MKDLKETMPTISKEKNIVLIIAIIVLIISIIFMMYLIFGESIKQKTLELTKFENSILKYKKNFNTYFEEDILKSEKFNNLKKQGTWPVEAGIKGRDNPFETFVVPPVEETESEEVLDE